MFELVHLKGNSYYIQSPVQVGVYKLNETEVILFDSGSDKDSAKRIKRQLDEQGWTVKTIFNTHHHADHIGGNKYMQDMYNCDIYVPGMDIHFTEESTLEAIALFGGHPFKELHHKFLMADSSIVKALTLEVLPDGIEIIDLKGHSPCQVGYRTKDNVVYLADAISSREILEKYGIGYNWDIANTLDTIEYIKTLEADSFVPCHIKPLTTDEMHELAEYNSEVIKGIADKICEFLKTPMIVDDLLQKLFEFYNMQMNVRQYVLISSTVKSYLTYLKESGRVGIKIENNKFYWEAIG